MQQSIADVLETDHAELDKLGQAVMAALDAADIPRSFEALDLLWARLAMHIRAEHLRLFPAIRATVERHPDELAQIPKLLAELREDHDYFMRESARAIKAMRLVFYFGNEDEMLTIIRDLLNGVLTRLETHDRREENILYPLASEAYLEPAEIDGLVSGIRKELDNYPARFTRTTKAS